MVDLVETSRTLVLKPTPSQEKENRAWPVVARPFARAHTHVQRCGKQTKAKGSASQGPDSTAVRQTVWGSFVTCVRLHVWVGGEGCVCARNKDTPVMDTDAVGDRLCTTVAEGVGVGRWDSVTVALRDVDTVGVWV